MRMYFLAIGVFLLFCGCGGHSSLTPLEQATAHLEPGMDKNQVKQLFVNCWLIGETNEAV